MAKNCVLQDFHIKFLLRRLNYHFKLDKLKFNLLVFRLKANGSALVILYNMTN
jgi:hypothetical protein